MGAILMNPTRFADFVEGEIADAQKTTEVLLALSADSREEVDRLRSTAPRTAAASGNRPGPRVHVRRELRRPRRSRLGGRLDGPRRRRGLNPTHRAVGGHLVLRRRRSLRSRVVALHPPKVETFAVDEGTNIDPKGFVRAVPLFREEPFGLYLSRPMKDHPSLDHMRSWLLPGLSIRVTDFRFLPGHERMQDFYVDIADVHREGPVWTTVDHYLDLVVHTGERTELLDVDEYVEAVAAGLLAPDAAERALTTAATVHAGVAEHGHDLDAGSRRAGWCWTGPGSRCAAHSCALSAVIPALVLTRRSPLLEHQACGPGGRRCRAGPRPPAGNPEPARAAPSSPVEVGPVVDQEVDDVGRGAPGLRGRPTCSTPCDVLGARDLDPSRETAGLLGPRRVGVDDVARPRRGLPRTQRGLERHDPLGPQGAHPFLDRVDVAGVVDPHVRRRPALLLGRLRADPGAGVVLGHAPGLGEPRDADVLGRVHDDDQRERRAHAVLHEQRHVVHDDGVVRRAGDQLGRPGADAGVQDPVQPVP